MAVIQKLKDYFTGNYIYPHTVTQAVWDERGNRLDNILKAGLSVDDDNQEDSFEPNIVLRDADTLGGKYSANDIDKAVTFDPDGEEEEIEDVVEVDADLFDGHTPDYYAKNADLIDFPNYRNRITFTTNTYTPTEDGYVLVARKASNTQLNKIVINGFLACGWIGFADSNEFSTSPLIPVSKGDEVTLSFDITSKGGGVETQRFFYPCVSH